MIIVDTDILIWILRGDRRIEKYFKDVVMKTEGYVFITPVQIVEIYAGLRPEERLKAEYFVESLNVVGIDRNTGKLAGEFINKYGKSHNVTMADALIAASTRINGFKLWTLNKRHYPMFEAKNFFEYPQSGLQS